MEAAQAALGGLGWNAACLGGAVTGPALGGGAGGDGITAWAVCGRHQGAAPAL